MADPLARGEQEQELCHGPATQAEGGTGSVDPLRAAFEEEFPALS